MRFALSCSRAAKTDTDKAENGAVTEALGVGRDAHQVLGHNFFQLLSSAIRDRLGTLVIRASGEVEFLLETFPSNLNQSQVGLTAHTCLIR